MKTANLFPIFTFATTNLIQFGMVMFMITPPPVCLRSCLVSGLTGCSIIPTILLVYQISNFESWNIVSRSLLSMACVSYPVILSVLTRLFLTHCWDANWIIWAIQGSNIPAMIWTVYSMIKQVWSQ